MLTTDGYKATTKLLIGAACSWSHQFGYGIRSRVVMLVLQIGGWMACDW
jgi:hypothetical protein